MSLHSGDGVVKDLSQSRKYLLMEVLLEFFSHIISHLPDAMKGSISNLGVRVKQMLDNNGDHWCNLLDVIKILTNLWERHKTSILVSPVLVISESSLDKGAEQRKHYFISNARYKSVNACLTECNRVLLFFLFVDSESLFRSHPLLINVLVNVDHELED